MARRVPPEVTQLFLRDVKAERPKGRRAAKAVGALIGGAVGAGLGFVILLVIFGWALGGDGQGGLAAVLLGVPIGGWIGAELGAVAARRR